MALPSQLVGLLFKVRRYALKHPAKFILITLLSSPVWSVSAQVYITPWAGYTGGGHVEDQNDNSYDLKANSSFALSIETRLEPGRVGFFYHTQSSTVDGLDTNNAHLHYLQFQSSIDYPLSNNVAPYLGIGVGASYIDADWVKDELEFSASIFTGIEYRISDSLALNTQLRWLGTVVDNDTSGVCELSARRTESCIIQFDTSWMNQFSAIAGVTLSF